MLRPGEGEPRVSKPAGPFPRPDATAPGDNEWWENCVPKNTWPRPKARTRDATSSGSEGSADPAGFRRGCGGLHLPAPARGLRVRGGGRRNAASGRGAKTHVPQTPRLRTDVAFHAFVVSSRGRQAIDVPSMF